MIFKDRVCTAVEILELDIENIIYKIYQQFRSYTVHIEALKTHFAYVLILHIPCVIFILLER